MKGEEILSCNGGRTCGKCSYWFNDENFTQCRRHAPSLMFQPTTGQSGTSWANTGEGDWCGDWALDELLMALKENNK